MNRSVCVRSHRKNIPVYLNIMLSVLGGWVIYFLCQVVVIYTMTLKGISLLGGGTFSPFHLPFSLFPTLLPSAMTLLGKVLQV